MEEDKTGYLIVLPQFKDEYKLITNLLKKVLPEFKPELFPDFVRNSWLDGEEYAFPIVKELIIQKENLVSEYGSKIKIIDDKINEIRTNYSFLTNILTSEGVSEFLVNNVYDVLKFIGYKNVIKADDIVEGNRQEDLRILDDKRFTVVEVKGHNGNPTEDDCQALLKYISRTMKREGRTDVQGILIVNHQRMLPPLQRNNPAFTEQQIKDAIRDGYKLVSTWELFQSARLLQECILSFEEIDGDLHTPGLFKAIPSCWKHIGRVEKLLKDKTVACVYLDIEEIRNGNEIIVHDGTNYFKQIIEEMMVDKKVVTVSKKGEPVSIKINHQISKQTNIYLKIS